MTRLKNYLWALGGHGRRLMKALKNPDMFLRYTANRIAPVMKWLGRGERALLPREIQLYVNTRCNSRCLMCDVGLQNRNSVYYRKMTSRGRETLSMDQWEQLFDELSVFKPEIHIVGLEPLLHPRIVDLCRMIRERDLYVYLITNGILLDGMAEDLIKTGINKVCVSVDGPERINDRIRGQGTYRKSVKGIEKMLHYREKLGSKTVVKTNFTINPWNYEHLHTYAGVMLNKVMVDYITIRHPFYVTAVAAEEHNRQYGTLGRISPVNLGRMDPACIDTDRLWREIEKLKMDYPAHRVFFHMDVSSPEKLRRLYREPDLPVSRRTCKIPWFKPAIQPNGDVVIHNRCFEYKTGNVAESSLRDIWRGERYRVFRSELKKAGYFPACLRCCGAHPRRI